MLLLLMSSVDCLVEPRKAESCCLKDVFGLARSPGRLSALWLLHWSGERSTQHSSMRDLHFIDISCCSERVICCNDTCVEGIRARSDEDRMLSLAAALRQARCGQDNEQADQGRWTQSRQSTGSTGLESNWLPMTRHYAMKAPSCASRRKAPLAHRADVKLLPACPPTHTRSIALMKQLSAASRPLSPMYSPYSSACASC